MNLQTVSENGLKASLYRDSYFEAFQMSWGCISQAELKLNWHIELMCDEIQFVLERVIEGKPKLYDLIFNVPPGTTKSSVVSIMSTPWMWSRMPEAQVISGSHTKTLSNELASKSRDILISDGYSSMFPDFELRSDQNVKSFYKNNSGGFRLATSVGAKVVGFHGHVLLVDDPINPLPEKSSSLVKFEEANDWIHQTLSMRVVDKAITPTIMVMQRLHQLDPTGYWMEWKKNRKVKHICLPADLSSGNVNPPSLKRFYMRGLLDPERLGEKVIKDLTETLGTFGAAAQLSQKPIAAGGNLFDVSQLMTAGNWVTSVPNKIIKTVRFWDNAATPGAGDFTAGPSLALDCTGKLWIVDLVDGQFGSAEREKIKKDTAELDGVGVEIGQEIEPGSSGKDSFRATVKNLSGYKVRGFRAVGSKEVRADLFSVQVNNGNVGMVKAPWNDRLVKQLQYFPHGANDDIVDGLSGCYQMIFRRRRKGKVA